jgi:ubiquinone/menaquinone biosynthesis C-methylase UbiE
MTPYDIKFGKDLKLNVGSGNHRTPGWISVDYTESGWLGENKKIDNNEIDINYNVIKKGIPFSNDTINCIYSSHFLEHMTWHDGILFLKECYRVLKIGGKIRLVVPDGDFFLKKFLEKDLKFFKDPQKCYNNWQGTLTDTFLWNFLGAFTIPKEQHFGRHAMFYNFENLEYRLKLMKFSGIFKKEYNKSSFEEFLPEGKFFKENKFPRETKSSLFIEAMKG